MNETICKALRKYENLIVLGGFNIDIKSSNSDKDKLENFCNLFNLTNLVHSKTCMLLRQVKRLPNDLEFFQSMFIKIKN